MTKILFIQGIHNYLLGDRWVRDVEEATGMGVVRFPMLYGLMEHEKQLALIRQVNEHIVNSDDRYIVLAHSLGGLLARSLSDEAYERIDRIIMLASPHRVPFAWFSRVVGKLPYRKELPVPVESCGFYFDPVVPFRFTRDPEATSHQNFIGTHTQVPNRKAFFRRLILDRP